MRLERHIIDTVKEWQTKIGYREGNMKLYYPANSLADLLGIAEETKENTADALTGFCREAETRLGRISVSESGGRYCLDIPAKGCAYIAANEPEPEFLKRLLSVITKEGNTLKQVRECFETYAAEQGCDYVEEAMDTGEGHGGHVFYFTDLTTDAYAYCVEENEFGLGYHRFTLSDYRKGYRT